MMVVLKILVAMVMCTIALVLSYYLVKGAKILARNAARQKLFGKYR